MADPTLSLLRSLNDESQWMVRRGVPAFRSHEREFPEQKLSDGTTVPKSKVVVKDDDLERIAKTVNERIAKTGELPTVTIGHRKFDPNFPEDKQPKLAGFAKNFRVEKVQRDGCSFKCLVYDEFVNRSIAEQTGFQNQYPYRSAEYHPQLGVHGVAALVRPPALNMGTVYAYAGSYLYQMGAEPMGDNEVFTPEEEKEYAGFSEHMKSYQADKAKKFWKKYESSIGPTNGIAPAPSGNEPPLNYQHSLVDAKLAELKRQNDELAKKIVATESARLLDKVKDVVKFDYQRELGVLSSLPTDTDREGHISYMLDTYQQLPVGGMIHVYSGDVAPQGKNAPAAPSFAQAPANHDQIMQYMRAHPGMTYELASAELLKK